MFVEINGVWMEYRVGCRGLVEKLVVIVYPLIIRGRDGKRGGEPPNISLSEWKVRMNRV